MLTLINTENMRTKKPLSNYRINKAKQRLRALLNRSEHTHVWDDGLRWYAEAYQFCEHVAHQRKLKTEQVAAVVSILSPSVHWEINKGDAVTLINAYQNNQELTDFSVSTYDGNKLKAWGYLAGDVKLEPKSLKTYAFYKNIMLNSEHVTIDRWMLRVFFQRPIKSLTAARYRLCEQIVKDVASEFNIAPYQAQAIAWERARVEAIDTLVEGVLYV